jgi:hypothetical protein
MPGPGLTVTSTNLSDFGGSLPASLPAPAGVFIETTDHIVFESNPNGSWVVGAISDFGSTSTWNLVTASVPALRIPMLIGLAVLLALLGAFLLKGVPQRRAA